MERFVFSGVLQDFGEMFNCLSGALLLRVDCTILQWQNAAFGRMAQTAVLCFALPHICHTQAKVRPIHHLCRGRNLGWAHQSERVVELTDRLRFIAQAKLRFCQLHVKIP